MRDGSAAPQGGNAPRPRGSLLSPGVAAWAWQDALILATIADTHGSTLAGILGAADYLNHALPTRDELASALGALLAAGLIELIEQGAAGETSSGSAANAAASEFRLTPEGRTLRLSWRVAHRWCEDLLPQLERLPRPTGRYALGERTYRAAVQEYSA